MTVNTLTLRHIVPIAEWLPRYRRTDLQPDLAAGLTVGAMLVPQAMAYALLAGLPPQIGLYASIVPVVVYALFGTSRQLAVGPVAIVSLLTASALAPLFEEGSAGYISAAALLALMVGAVHLVLGVGRLGFVVNFLSHSVLVGFTAAAAIIIGSNLGDTHAALPQAALGAIIIVAVLNLIDVAEMRHIARVKRSDLIGLSVAFVATLVLGIEIGILVAVVASMLVVFARMSRPHSAVLGRIPDTTSYRNVARFPEAETTDGIRVVRIDAALSFVNSQHVKRLCLDEAAAVDVAPRALVLECSGINDIDATGAATLEEIITELDEGPVALHLCDVKGPVRDVLRRAGLWDRLTGRVHATPHQAVLAIARDRPTRALRAHGVDEHTDTDHPDREPSHV